MRSKFKKVLAAVSAIAVSCTTFMGIPQSAFAADAPDYLALGDSISTGYGLAAPETDGFVYLLADAIGYELTNNAADGNTAAGIYTQISGGAMDTAITDAELITITCGGNDMMGLLYQRIADAYNASDANTTKITAADVSSALAGTHATLTQSALMFHAITALEGFSTSAEFTAGLTAFSASLSSVMNYINGKNPDAEVIVNTQYNPYQVFNGNAFYGSVYTEMEAGSIALNEVITGSAETLGYTVADVYTAFSTSAENLCNADASNMLSPNLDFHPNAAGHTVIADTVYAAVEGSNPCSHTVENGVCTICGMISIDETSFPDEIFRTYIDENFDTTDDDMLDAEEIAAATEINVSEMGISDLAGVEYFTALTYLDCSGSQLTSLDVSNNTVLESLYCSGNSYNIDLVGGAFDLSALPNGFDAARAADWINATVDGNTLIVLDLTQAVTYTYDLGSGSTEIFVLNPVSCTITEDTVSAIADQTYTGTEAEPEMTVVCGSYTLVPDVDYTVSYENNVDAGTASAIITGTGDFYTGEVTVEFEIKKATPAVTPVIPEDEYTEGDELPEISYESEISGIIEWITELIGGLIEGENELEWQFTPDDTDNYEVVTGTEIVEAQATTTTTTTTASTTDDGGSENTTTTTTPPVTTTVVKGDAENDCDVDTGDANRVLDYIDGLIAMFGSTVEEHEAIADAVDVDGDGAITKTDAALILGYAAHQGITWDELVSTIIPTADIDMTALNAKLAEAEAITSDGTYTEESYAALQEVIEAVKATQNAENLPYGYAEQMTNLLNAVIEGLEENLPQTGYSVIYNYIMLAAAAMVLLGIYGVAQGRKKDEE